MKILLSLPDITELRLKQAQDNIQSAASLSSISLTKEIANLVIEAIDYSPHDVSYKDLEFFPTQFADNLRELILDAVQNSKFDIDRQIFWLAFYLSALQYEATSLRGKFSSDEIKLGAFLRTKISSFEPDIQQRIIYLNYGLSVDIANRKITRFTKQQLDTIANEAGKVISAADTIKGWSNKLEDWERKVNDQESKLKNQLVKLNFVGLSKAFLNLISEKKFEKTTHAIIAFILGVALALTPISLAILSKNTEAIIRLDNIHTMAAMAAFEFVLFYLFRVALQNYASAKAQLLQLKLRYELCAFVEGYSEFIEPLRQKSGADTLSKFENIVFSGISPDPQNVPSQFDGLENVLKLIKAAKSD